MLFLLHTVADVVEDMASDTVERIGADSIVVEF